MQLDKDKGIALIIFALILALVATSFLFLQLDGSGVKIEREKKTAAVLLEAKNAILGWSISQMKPGLLPCPEDTTLINTVNEGTALATCISPIPVVGTLPWKTLGLGDLRDGNGDRLWYALSTGFSDATLPINSTTIGNINLNGTPNAAIAIIFSPGIALAGQNRTTPTSLSPPVITDYLDLTNNDGDITFINNGPASTFNDNLILVTQSDLFNLVARRILREVRGDATQGLVSFYNANSFYPFADISSPVDGNADLGEFGVSPIGHPSYSGTSNTDSSNIFFKTPVKDMLVNNNWPSLINYRFKLNSNQSVTMTLNGQKLDLP
jgi:hypothetical protein